MIGLQAEKHQLIDGQNFRSREDYVLHLIHTFAYLQVASIAKDKIILDLGCNTGYGTEILFKNAKRVVGVDVSNKAINTAKKNYSKLNIDFQFTIRLVNQRINSTNNLLNRKQVDRLFNLRSPDLYLAEFQLPGSHSQDSRQTDRGIHETQLPGIPFLQRFDIGWQISIIVSLQFFPEEVLPTTIPEE